MVDTVRSLSALQTLLADNTAGDISAQDVRDFLVSAYPRSGTPGAIPTSGWTWVNQGSATVTSVNGALSFASPATAAANLIGYVRTAPATPYVIRAELVATSLDNQSTGVAGYGLCFRESSTGKLGIIQGRARNDQDVVVENWTNPTTFSATLQNRDVAYPGFPRQVLQIADNGTNLLYSFGSFDDSSAMIQTTSAARTAFMAGGPDQVGIIARDNNLAVRWAVRTWTQE